MVWRMGRITFFSSLNLFSRELPNSRSERGESRLIYEKKVFENMSDVEFNISEGHNFISAGMSKIKTKDQNNNKVDEI